MSHQPWDSHSGTAYEAYEVHVGMVACSEFESVAFAREIPDFPPLK